MKHVFLEDKQSNNDNTIGSLMGTFEDKVMGLVDILHQNYVTVAATSQTTAATDITEAYKAEVKILTTIQEIDDYDITDGYPNKLNF